MTSDPVNRTLHRDLWVRVDPDTHRRFQELAKREHRSVAGELRYLVERRLAEEDGEKQAA